MRGVGPNTHRAWAKHGGGAVTPASAHLPTEAVHAAAGLTIGLAGVQQLLRAVEGLVRSAAALVSVRAAAAHSRSIAASPPDGAR